MEETNLQRCISCHSPDGKLPLWSRIFLYFVCAQMFGYISDRCPPHIVLNINAKMFNMVRDGVALPINSVPNLSKLHSCIFLISNTSHSSSWAGGEEGVAESSWRGACIVRTGIIQRGGRHEAKQSEVKRRGENALLK